ncbi:uncharacterized protein C3orf18 homolog isoform X2 [Brachyhypopomus gauderio]|uniref:uncharacterized protein C3orf18 homolog isoform X2 n=1 Tax=Brachyhypopomus gauderio TaxID=698409 RepID=UPI00404110A2
MHHCLEEEDSRPLSESLLSGKDTFNCNSFLGLMALYHERTKNQDTELRAAFKVFDAESKSYIDWNTLMYVLMNAGEPLNEEEAVQMMKETDKDGTIDYEVTIQTAPPRPRRRSREEGEIRERKQRERERKRDGVRDKQTQRWDACSSALSYETLLPFSGPVSAYCCSWDFTEDVSSEFFIYLVKLKAESKSTEIRHPPLLPNPGHGSDNPEARFHEPGLRPHPSPSAHSCPLSPSLPLHPHHHQFLHGQQDREWRE